MDASRGNIPMSPAEWTPEARTALAACLWGEAQVNRNDWPIIAWALLRRWRAYQDMGRPRSFAWVVRAYSAPVKPRLASEARMREARAAGNQNEIRLIHKRRFVQALRIGIPVPRRELRRIAPGVNPKVSDRMWAEIGTFVEAWGRGEIADSCPAAEHWDHPGAVARAGMVRVRCGRTRNIYYRWTRRVRTMGNR